MTLHLVAVLGLDYKRKSKVMNFSAFSTRASSKHLESILAMLMNKKTEQ